LERSLRSYLLRATWKRASLPWSAPSETLFNFDLHALFLASPDWMAFASQTIRSFLSPKIAVSSGGPAGKYPDVFLPVLVSFSLRVFNFCQVV
jgi:hypothetical protein